MKKFSKLITESKTQERKPSRFMNIVDWDEKIKPIIELFEENGYIFSDRTKSKLDDLIDLIETDYKANWIDEVHDGSQESFFGVYDIKVDYQDIIDCILPLMDRTEDIEDNANFEWGAYNMVLSNPRFPNLEELIEDVGDVHEKLQMLNVDFKISVNTSVETFDFYRGTKDIDNLFLKKWTMHALNLSRLNDISIFIYNKDTVEAIDLQGE